MTMDEMKTHYETLLDALTNEMQAMRKELQECKEQLSQEQCGDCISRNYLANIFKYEDDGRSKYQTMMLYEISDIIEDAPSVSPMPKWIPVSERLPEDNTFVLVTVKVGNREPKVRSGYYYMDGHFHIDNGDSWESRDKELIAWMPLQTPYQPEIPTGAEGSEE